MSQPKFTIGDKVRPKAGGPVMLVVDFNRTATSFKIICAYPYYDAIREDHYLEDELIKVDKDSILV